MAEFNKETKYARQKAQGKKFSQEEEARFWSAEHEGQAKVMEALIQDEPETHALKESAHNLVQQLYDNHKEHHPHLQKVRLANTTLDNIGLELQKNPSLSSVPPKLAAHEERERNYAKAIFEKFH